MDKTGHSRPGGSALAAYRLCCPAPGDHGAHPGSNGAGLPFRSGGKAEEHKAEMRKIAEETIYELVPKISAEIYNNALQRLLGAIHYDVESVVSVAIDGVGEIFNGHKVQKIISDRIMQEMKARLTDIDIKIK